MAFLLLAEAKRHLRQTGATRVIISGGCFQNKRLTEQLQRLFADEGIPLYVPGRIPCNEGELPSASWAIAASRKNSTDYA